MRLIILVFLLLSSLFSQEFQIKKHGKVAATVHYESCSEECQLIGNGKVLFLSRVNDDIQYQYIENEKIVFTIPHRLQEHSKNEADVKVIKPSKSAQAIALESAKRVLDHLKNNTALSMAAEYQILSMLYVSADKYREANPFQPIMPKCHSLRFNSGYGETKFKHYYEPEANYGIKTTAIFGGGAFYSNYQYVLLDYVERSTFELSITNYIQGDQELHLRKLKYGEEISDYEPDKIFDIALVRTPFDESSVGEHLGEKYFIMRGRETIGLNHKLEDLVGILKQVYQKQEAVEEPYSTIMEILKKHKIHSAYTDTKIEIEANPKNMKFYLSLLGEVPEEIADASKLTRDIANLFLFATAITVERQ